MAIQLLSADAVGAELGIRRRTVYNIARRAGIGTHVGRYIVFTPDDIPLIRGHIRPGPGNPLMVPGNQLWRRNKWCRQQDT